MADCLFREGLASSESVAALEDWPYRVYTLLLLRADYAGRTDGRLSALRSLLFPLGTSRREVEFAKAIDQMVAPTVPRDGQSIALPSLVIRYEFNGKPYLQITKVTKRCNGKTSKYPWSDGSYSIE